MACANKVSATLQDATSTKLALSPACTWNLQAHVVTRGVFLLLLLFLFAGLRMADTFRP